MMPFVSERPNYVELNPGAGSSFSSGSSMNVPAPGSTDYKPPQRPTFNDGSDPLQMIFSVIAAARGQVGPLMSILDQKRKTQVYSAIPEIFTEYNALINKGKIDEATNYFTSAVGQLGARAPEVGQFLQPVLTQAAQRQKDWQNLQSYIRGAEAFIAEKPDSPQAELLKKDITALKKIQTPLDAATFGRLVQNYAEFEHRMTPSGTAMISSSKAGEHRTTPIQAYAKVGDISDYTIQTIAKETANSAIPLGPEDVINIKNGVPVIRNGRDITPILREGLTQRIAQLEGQKRDIELARLVPYTPEWNERFRIEMQQQGAKDQLLAEATKGAVGVTGGAKSPLATSEATRERVLEDKERALRLPYDIDYSQKYVHQGFPGHRAINIDPTSPTMGEIVNISQKEVDANPSKYRSVPDAIHEKKIIPSLQAIRQLNLVKDLFDVLGNPENYDEIIPTGLVRQVSDRLGISLDTGITYGRAYQMIIDRAINAVMSTESQQNESVGRLKASIIGPFASASEALRNANVLQTELKQQLVPYIGENALKISVKTEPVQAPPTPEQKARQQTTTSLQTEQTTLSGVYEPLQRLVSGVKNVADPLKTSTTWSPDVEKNFGNLKDFNTRQVLNSFIEPALKTLKQADPTLKDANYLIAYSDSPQKALAKFKSVVDLVNGKVEDRKPGLKWEQRRK